MGVAGAGKSSVGAALARALGVAYAEGDDWHPPENRARMAAGIPLTDEDRAPWLAALAGRIAESRREGTGLVLACSALKRRYRDVLRQSGAIRFIYLRGTRPLIAERLEGRSGHFMPATLLDSQLSALEEPAPDEDAWSYDVTAPVDEIVLDIVGRLVRGAATRAGGDDVG